MLPKIGDELSDSDEFFAYDDNPLDVSLDCAEENSLPEQSEKSSPVNFTIRRNFANHCAHSLEHRTELSDQMKTAIKLLKMNRSTRSPLRSYETHT